MASSLPTKCRGSADRRSLHVRALVFWGTGRWKGPVSRGCRGYLWHFQSWSQVQIPVVGWSFSMQWCQLTTRRNDGGLPNYLGLMLVFWMSFGFYEVLFGPNSFFLHSCACVSFEPGMAGSRQVSGSTCVFLTRWRDYKKLQQRLSTNTRKERPRCGSWRPNPSETAQID